MPAGEAASILWWDQALFFEGQVWRVFTHLGVHADALHAGTNSLVALALWGWSRASKTEAGVLTLSVALYLALVPFWGGPAWGASGVLHAWAAALALQAQGLSSRVRGILWGTLCLKILAEAAGLGPPVAWGLHVSGLIAGTAAATWWLCLQGARQPRTQHTP